MAPLRHFLSAHCRIAALVLALALCVKGVVPVGYMFENQEGSVVVRICGGQAGGEMLLALSGKSKDHGSEHAQKAEHCAFGMIGSPALGGANPWLLAAALLFVLLLSLAPVRLPLLPAPVRERPPLRAPPANS